MNCEIHAFVLVPSDGRWENASVPRVDDKFYHDHGIDKDQLWYPAEADSWYQVTDQAHTMNPYGLLRSPWNWNPNPYVTRFNSVNMIKDISYIDPSVRSYYSGVNCLDVRTFVEDDVKGQPFSEFLHFAEDDVHGKIHFTFGGAGGENAYSVNQILKTVYGLNDTMLLIVAQGEQTFVKQAYPLYNARSYYGSPYPFNCTEMPWGTDTQTLWTDATPGSPDATCSLNPYYCESQDTMIEFYQKYMTGFQDTTKGDQFSLEEMLLGMDLTTQCQVANLLVSRAGYDGEMAGSGAAQDPLFWVAHGAVERLMQMVIFSGITTDTTYDVEDSNCSGHQNDVSAQYNLIALFLLMFRHFHRGLSTG
jgi:hypothetical protein